MEYFTATIPLPLAEKLKAAGMPMITSVSISIVEDKPVVDENGEQWYRPMFAEVFDWLMSKGFACEVYGRGSGYDYVIVKECNDATRGTNLAHNNYEGPNGGACWDTWHEAAEKAIEKALELI